MNNPNEVKYRLGRSQKRVVLTQDGSKQVATFEKEFMYLAPKVIDFLNEQSPQQGEGKGMDKIEFFLKWFIKGYELNWHRTSNGLYREKESVDEMVEKVMANYTRENPPSNPPEPAPEKTAETYEDVITLALQELEPWTTGKGMWTPRELAKRCLEIHDRQSQSSPSLRDALIELLDFNLMDICLNDGFCDRSPELKATIIKAKTLLNNNK